MLRPNAADSSGDESTASTKSRKKPTTIKQKTEQKAHIKYKRLKKNLRRRKSQIKAYLRQIQQQSLWPPLHAR